MFLKRSKSLISVTAFLCDTTGTDCIWNTICIVIKQGKSEVGNDMLLVSEDSFHLKYVNSRLKPGTCRRYIVNELVM